MNILKENYTFLFSERKERLHSMLINCGHEIVSSPSYRWDGTLRGNRNMIIWQYTIAGCGAFDFNGETLKVLPGSALLGIVPESHCYYLPKFSQSWEFIYLTMTGSEASRLANAVRQYTGGVISYKPDSQVLKLAYDVFSKAKRGEINNAYRASAISYEFFMTSMHEAISTIGAKQSIFLEKIHNYALKHLAENVTVDDMAKLANCSKWHFSRLFTKSAGKSPHQFLLDLRMRFAEELLQTTNYSVKEIANKCGFEDATYFCKIFRKYFSTSPKRFRNCDE